MRFFFISLILLLVSIQAGAQSPGGVWEKVGSVRSKGSNALAKKGSSLRRWQQHLEDWGTDTSFNHEAGILGRLHSDGWALGIYTARKSEDGRKLLGVHLIFSEVLHEKQTKQQRTATTFPELGSGVPYVFGKTTNLYTLNVLLTQDRSLFPGVLEGSVSLGWRWGAGISLALLKPYYLSLLYVDYSKPEPIATVHEESYSESNADLFLNPSTVLGSGKWQDGLSEIKLVPGITGEIAITIAPTRSKIFVPTLALGVVGAFYTQKLPIMANQQSYRWEARLFASLQLGKRW